MTEGDDISVVWWSGLRLDIESLVNVLHITCNKPDAGALAWVRPSRQMVH